MKIDVDSVIFIVMKMVVFKDATIAKICCTIIVWFPVVVHRWLIVVNDV